jgi:hypothetical protein
MATRERRKIDSKAGAILRAILASYTPSLTKSPNRFLTTGGATDLLTSTVGEGPSPRPSLSSGLNPGDAADDPAPDDYTVVVRSAFPIAIDETRRSKNQLIS